MCAIAVPTYAINETSTSTVDSEIIYFDDGSYIVTTLVIETSKSEIATASTTYTTHQPVNRYIDFHANNVRFFS